MRAVMPGILEHVFGVRTQGNGWIRSPWDEILLLRDLEQLVVEGRAKIIRETPHIGQYSLPGEPEECATKWFQDSETGEIYEYREAWERRGPRFEKLNVDERYKPASKARPI